MCACKVKSFPCSVSLPFSIILFPAQHPFLTSASCCPLLGMPPHLSIRGTKEPRSRSPPGVPAPRRWPQQSAAAWGVCGAPRRQPPAPPGGLARLLAIKKTFSFPPFLPFGPEPEGGERLKERQASAGRREKSCATSHGSPPAGQPRRGLAFPSPSACAPQPRRSGLGRATGPRGKRLGAPGKKSRASSLPRARLPGAEGGQPAAHLRRGQGGGEGGHRPWGAGGEVSLQPQPTISNKARGCA